MTNCKCSKFFKGNPYKYRLAFAITNRMQQFMNWHQKQPDQNPNWYKSGENRFCPQPMPLNINNQKADKEWNDPVQETAGKDVGISLQFYSIFRQWFFRELAIPFFITAPYNMRHFRPPQAPTCRDDYIIFKCIIQQESLSCLGRQKRLLLWHVAPKKISDVQTYYSRILSRKASICFFISSLLK